MYRFIFSFPDPGCTCVSVLQLELQADQEVVVYDQSSADPAALSSESFISVLLVKLERSFPSVHLLSGEPPCTRVALPLLRFRVWPVGNV